ncbi:MAG: endonuclease [Muribaculum sp.]|nr:endonuclease [Muribaculaceae bacterium]MCM1080566.1 endonuclease [Muribaculum sp.]
MKSTFPYIVKAIASVIAIVCFNSISYGADDSTVYDNLSGRALKNRIAQDKPQTELSATQAASAISGIYNGRKCCYTSVVLVSDVTIDVLLPAKWIVSPFELKKMSSGDLFNYVVVDVKALANRGGLPISAVNKIQDQGNGWRKGLNLKGNVVFEPADENKGRIARAFFYLASLYPADLWEGNGAVTFRDFRPYPSFADNIVAVYLEWNREYPTTEEEMALNNLISEIQGNRNPFIDYPDIADHIWGSKKSIPYNSKKTGNEDPDMPDIMPEKYLKSSYNLNETIWLNSPLAGNGAIWKVDGKQMTSACVNASELGIGKHELSFKCNNKSGRLIITINL